jgi:nephrocystin-4
MRLPTTCLAHPLPSAAQNEPKASVISKGSLVLRALNLGRESRNTDARLPEFDDAHNKPSKKRVRAKPAWEVPASPIAKELAGTAGGCHLPEFTLILKRGGVTFPG